MLSEVPPNGGTFYIQLFLYLDSKSAKRMCHILRMFLISSYLIIVLPSFAQSLKYQKQLITLKRVIEREHYNPRAVDDQFSSDLFDRFIERLDEDKLYFTADDIKQLSVFRLQLDDELKGQQWNFLDKVLPLYKSRLKKSDSTISSLLQKPFDFNQAENLALFKDSIQFAITDQQLKKKWQKWLKYEILLELNEICYAKKIDAKSCLQFEGEAREKVKSTNARNIKKMLEHPSGYENNIVTIYCDLLATSFDPHTQYMPPTEKETFESNLNTEGYYFGLSVTENEKGQIELAGLMPGSPAWNSGELNQGDVLLELKWEGKAAIDLNGARPEEVSEILDNSNQGRMEFTARKRDGVIKKVWLAKEKIRNDDNSVKGFVLKGTSKLGYIYLPGFYTDFSQSFPSSCANDVAKEVVKLKKENIQGLILDLRYNGGGSLQEALDMAGIFIDEGPLTLIKEKSGKILSLKDMNRGTIYDGPLLLLVNGQSASASELLAAVLQDYNRAIIAGGNTFGKGTAQVIFPVDTSRSGPGSVVTDQNPEYGFVKVTISKFYRVSGTTTQHQGVKPDILMPDILDELDIRESTAYHSLTADEVKKNPYYKPLSLLPIASLKKNSETRLQGNATFGEIKKFAHVLQQERNVQEVLIPLRWNDYYQKANYHPATNSEMEKLQHTATNYVPENTLFDKDKLKNDDYLKELNKQWLKRVTGDIYIQEAFNILNDYITLIANKTN